MGDVGNLVGTMLTQISSICSGLLGNLGISNLVGQLLSVISTGPHPPGLL